VLRPTDRRAFLKQVGLGAGVAGGVQLVPALFTPPALAQGLSGTIPGPPPGIFAAGRIIGKGNGVILLTNREHASLPVLLTNSTRIWKGVDTTLDQVQVGDYTYCVTVPLPDGKLTAVSLWLNQVLAPVAIVSNAGSTLRGRIHGDPKREGEIRLTSGTLITGGSRAPLHPQALVPGTYVRVLGTVLADQTLLATKIFVASGQKPPR